MALRSVGEFEADLAALAADPALADLVRPGALLLVTDIAAETLLWASRAGREALSLDQAERIEGVSPAALRIQAVARELAPDDPVRFEPLRLGTQAAGGTSLFAFRRVLLPSGPALLVAAVDHPGGANESGESGQKGPRRTGTAASLADREPDAPRPKRARPQAKARARASERTAAPSGRQRGCIRFVWQADAEGRFVHVSGGLAEAVGPDAADIMGRTWDEIVGRLVEDPDGIVSGRLARQETWSDCTVLWRAGQGHTIPVELAGLATFGPGRRLSGYRGFGLIRDATAPPEGAEGPRDDVRGPPGNGTTGTPAGLRPEAEARPSPAPLAPGRTRAGIRPFPGLSASEREAFRDIARALGSRSSDEGAGVRLEADPTHPPHLRPIPREALVQVTPAKAGAVADDPTARIVDDLPIPLLVHNGGEVLFANRALRDRVASAVVQELARRGGPAPQPSAVTNHPRPANDASGPSVVIPDRSGGTIRAELHDSTTQWRGRTATVTVLREIGDEPTHARARALEADLQGRETRLGELTSILDTAMDGVVILDEAGRILSLNRSAEALFGYDQSEVAGQSFAFLFAPEAAQTALDYLAGLRANGVESLLNDGREILGLVRQGGTIPLSMALGRLGDGPSRTFCAVLRDNTAAKKAERDLIAAKHAAEEASARKSELLARISHEIRTPLNAIVGFTEVMLAERFGSVGNERYRDYLKDIRGSGVHVVSLVDDLLDLAKAEAGEMALSFGELDLNAIVGACVAEMQPAAARERIVVRTSFAPKLPRVLADERSTRQVAATVIANAVRFTPAGGQVIVSTALTDAGEVAFRVRDTGVGMTKEQLEQALEPFRPVATARPGGGSGLGLPLTRALVHANRGALHITSARNEGTLVEVLYPRNRLLAQEPSPDGGSPDEPRAPK